MIELLVALAVFVLAHGVPARPAIRDRLVARLGRGVYLAGYSVVSLALLVWFIDAARRAPVVTLWAFAPWQAWLPMVAMPVALALLFAGLASPNPLSVSFSAGGGKGAIVAITRHPVLWGFLLWALAHLPPNGDAAALVAFGAMAVLAGVGMPLVDRRARARLGEEAWHALAASTSVLPFAALVAGRARLFMDRPLAWSVIAAVAASAALLAGGHAALFGVDPLAALG